MNKKQARLHATIAAFEILRFNGFYPDPEEFPSSDDRTLIRREFGEVLNLLEKRATSIHLAIERRSSED